MIEITPFISEHDLARFEVWMHTARQYNADHAWKTRLIVRRLIRAGCRTRAEAGGIFQSIPSQRKSSLRNAFGLFLEFRETDEL